MRRRKARCGGEVMGGGGRRHIRDIREPVKSEATHLT